MTGSMSQPLTNLSKPDRKAGHNTCRILAAMTGVSEVAIFKVQRMQRDATREVIALMELGSVSIEAAFLVSTLPADEQRAAAAGGKAGLKAAAKAVRLAKADAKAASVPTTPVQHARIASLKLRVAYWRARAERAEQALANRG